MPTFLRKKRRLYRGNDLELIRSVFLIFLLQGTPLLVQHAFHHSLSRVVVPATLHNISVNAHFSRFLIIVNINKDDNKSPPHYCVVGQAFQYLTGSHLTLCLERELIN